MLTLKTLCPFSHWPQRVTAKDTVTGTASRHNLHLRDEQNKEISFLLQEAKTWKSSASNINGLKGLYVLQLVLHLTEGSEIKHQIFHTFDMEDQECENGWKTTSSLLGKNYKSNGTAVVFNTCKKFGALSHK